MTFSRRKLLASGGAAALAAQPLAQAFARQVLVTTPAMTEGPFYPRRLPVDRDADLLRVGRDGALAAGTPLYLTGQVLTPDNRPMAGVRVEIWQCDARAVYHHVGVTGGDPNFQGWGAATTDAEGRYAFRTIRPVPYPGRTPHIHFRVTGRGIDRLSTQMFVAGDPGNASDFLYNRIDPRVRRALEARLSPAAGREAGALSGRFHIVLSKTTESR